MGIDPERLDGPIVGIASTWTGTMPCNLNLRRLADRAAAAVEAVGGVALIFKLHILLGLTIFLLFPFTRLVHMLSAPVRYLWRPGYQIVRSKRGARPGVGLNPIPATVAGREALARTVATRDAGTQHDPLRHAAE